MSSTWSVLLALLMVLAGGAHAQTISGGSITNGTLGQATLPGTVTASFTARKIQGSTCVAPCAVHFDPIGNGTNETTDSVYTREFHTLLYMWHFGDPESGDWTTGARARAGLSSLKNIDQGPGAGHVYTQPGEYTVALKVWNPVGDSSTTTRQVVVADPAAHFSAANTRCLATSADWTGCPLDCGGADAERCLLVDGSPTFSTAITGGDNCDGSDDCANADSSKKRILLRRGDTYTTTALTDLMISDADPGMIEAFGEGAEPIINQSGGDFRPGRGWTVTGVRINNGSQGALFVPGAPGLGSDNDGRRDNVTFYDISAGFTTTCINAAQTSEGVVTRFQQLQAFVEVRCQGDGSSGGYGSWLHTDHLLWMGVTFDNGNAAGGLSSLRSQHVSWAVFAHNDWINAGSGREHMQLRAWDGVAPGSQGTDLEDDKWVLIADNFFEEPGNGGMPRWCVDSGCNCSQGSCSPGDGAGHVVDTKDFVFERNFTTYDSRGPSGRFGLLEVQGGSHTIRNNVWDLQGAQSGSFALIRIHGEPSARLSGSSLDGDVRLYNNTLFADDAAAFNMEYTGGIGVGGSGCPTGCETRNNLVVWPGYTGDSTPNDMANVTPSNNLLTTSESVLASPPAEVALTQIDDFALASPNGSTINAGFNLGRLTDALGLCRGLDAGWDIGALEFGAGSSCFPP